MLSQNSAVKNRGQSGHTGVTVRIADTANYLTTKISAVSDEFKPATAWLVLTETDRRKRNAALGFIFLKLESAQNKCNQRILFSSRKLAQVNSVQFGLQ
jgi:hypothetical protein